MKISREKILKYLKKNNIKNLSKLALKSELTTVTIFKLVNNKTSILIKSVKRIADALNCKVEDIIDLE